MVAGLMRHVVLLRPGGHDATGHPEAGVVVGAGNVTRLENGRHVVRLHGGLRGDVVVPASVLVVDPEQRRLVPRRSTHHRIDEQGGVALTHRDVPVLLGEVGVGIDEAERRQVPRCRVGEELGHVHGLGRIVEEHGLEEGTRRQVGVVVLPGDAVVVEAVEDRAVGGVDLGDARHVGAEVAQRGAGDEEAAIRVGLGHDRREVAVADGELPCHGVVEGKVPLVPVAHGRAAARLDEAHVGAVVPRRVRGVPALGDARVGLAAGVGQVERAHVATGRIRVEVDRLPVPSGRQPVPAAQRAQVVVERVVLHHEHDDVLDLREGVGSRRKVRVGERSGLAQREPSGQTGGPCRGRVGLAADGRSQPGRDRAGEQRPAGEPLRPRRVGFSTGILVHRRYGNSACSVSQSDQLSADDGVATV